MATFKNAESWASSLGYVIEKTPRSEGTRYDWWKRDDSSFVGSCATLQETIDEIVENIRSQATCSEAA